MNPYALAILETTRRLWFGRGGARRIALPLLQSPFWRSVRVPGLRAGPAAR